MREMVNAYEQTLDKHEADEAIKAAKKAALTAAKATPKRKRDTDPPCRSTRPKPTKL